MKYECENKPNDSDKTVETNNTGQWEQVLKVIVCFGCDECKDLIFNTSQTTAKCSWSKTKIWNRIKKKYFKISTVPHWTLTCDVSSVEKGLLEWENFGHYYIWNEWHSDWDEKLHNQKHGQCKIVVVSNRFSNRIDALWCHAIWGPTSRKECPTVDAWNWNLVFAIFHFPLKKLLLLSIFAKKIPSATHSVQNSKWSFRPLKWDKFFVFRAFEL